MSKLDINFWFLSPVQVVRVTPKNLEEVAKWCGGRVAKVESRRVKGRVDQYVWVPTPKGSAVSWAFPGMYITKRLAVTEQNSIKETYSVFRRDYFSKNYFQDPKIAVDETWERHDREQKKAARDARTITIEIPEGQDPKVALQIIEAQLSGIEEDAAKASFPESMVTQREQLHEDAVEAAVEEEIPAPKAGSLDLPGEGGPDL